jgi:hypothetical protein
VSISIALGLPHTPWVPTRVESFARLCTSLSYGHGRDLISTAACRDGVFKECHTRVFDEKESNRIWPGKLYRWAISTGATHCLQLQDDALVYDKFWPALQAMLEAVPDQIIGLEANHPLGPEMHRTGRRWFRTRAWLVGVGYVWPMDPNLPHGLPAFLRWCEEFPAIVAQTNEDSLVNGWAAQHGFDIWHPVPTIIDHDIGVPSTYGNDGHHEYSMYRRPTVTWRDVPLLSGLTDPDYWRTTVEGTPLLPGPGTQRCWFCGERQAGVTSQKTGCRVCPLCALSAVGAYMGNPK